MSTRDRILDAAAEVLHEKGVAGVTTREIARAAGCSEALLYKYFADKQEIFLSVLAERLPVVRPAEGIVGTGELVENLAALVQNLLDFFVRSFPMSVSIFGTPALLAEHRSGVASRGLGPDGPIRFVTLYLDEERDIGRLPAAADTESGARLLVGAAFHRAFLAAYEGSDSVADGAEFARRTAALVAAALEGPGVSPRP